MRRTRTNDACWYETVPTRKLAIRLNRAPSLDVLSSGASGMLVISGPKLADFASGEWDSLFFEKPPIRLDFRHICRHGCF